MYNDITNVNDLIGKVVQIYPNDTYEKYGEIIEITNNGILFKITKAESNSGYEINSFCFISYSANLTFSYI